MDCRDEIYRESRFYYVAECPSARQARTNSTRSWTVKKINRAVDPASRSCWAASMPVRPGMDLLNNHIGLESCRFRDQVRSIPYTPDHVKT